jgi:HAD superfamily hydrolase (TIGR01450 family)
MDNRRRQIAGGRHTATITSTDMHEFNDTDGVLFDLDGTLVSGGKALPWAHHLIEKSRGRFVIVTNDAEHTSAEVSAMMNGLGFPVQRDRIVMAGMEAIRQVAEEMPQARIFMATSQSLKAHASDLGLHPGDDRPDVVLIGRDRSFSYETIRNAANAVLSGARLVICNPDLTHPGIDGAVVPETGALAASILSCTGPVPHSVVGKPYPGLFLAGMEILGSKPTETVMIGDNPDTDGRGATDVGMRFIHVLTAARLDLGLTW